MAKVTHFDEFWLHAGRGDPNDCWEWQRGTGRGYGRVFVNGRTESSHRVAWKLTYGPIPDGLFVCHRCDNPPCCNPNHLFLGTCADNTHDAMAKGRLKPPPLAPPQRPHTVAWLASEESWRECEWCGRSFQAVRRQDPKRFCDRGCFHKHRLANATEIKNQFGTFPFQNRREEQPHPHGEPRAANSTPALAVAATLSNEGR